MKNYVYGLLLVFLILAGCSKKLDINQNPVLPVSTTPNLLLPAVLGNMAYHIYSQARFTSYHSFYITGRTANGSSIEDKWDYNGIIRLGAWRWHYFDVGSNCITLAKTAEKESSNNYVGVAKIILGYSYLTATDVFGDMPVKEAYTADFSPLYDQQEYVYSEVARLLDEGVAALEKSGSSDRKMDGTSDFIFQGDLSKWTAFAHAVRARMLLHTASFKDGYDKVIAAVDNALVNWKDAIYRFAETPQNNWERNMWGPTAPVPEWNFADIKNNLVSAVSTDFFMNAMKVGSSDQKYDPRLYALTSPGKKGIYSGTRASEGLNPPEDAYSPLRTADDFASLYNGIWTSDNSPQPYILKEELYFIKAEAAFHKNDFATALAAYTEGIKSNLTRLVTNADSISNYLASDKVKKTEADLQISDIMMQKYIALYLQPETWVDMRRYKYKAYAYPGIYYPKNIFRDLSLSAKWIQRLPYDPQTEYIYNPNEIARLGATKRDWVGVPLWWAEKSTL